MADDIPKGVVIRHPRDDELSQMEKLSREVGWRGAVYNYRQDRAVFGKVSYLAAFDEYDVLIGMANGCIQSNDIAYISSVAVTSSHRNRGIASALLRRILHSLGERNIILDSMTELKDFYSHKFGFNHVIDNVFRIKISLPEGVASSVPENVRRVDKSSVRDVMSYDASLHNLGRRKNVERALRNRELFSLFAKVDGVVSGFLVVQYTLSICLYADTPEVAEQLLRGLVMWRPDNVTPDGTTYPFLLFTTKRMKSSLKRALRHSGIKIKSSTEIACRLSTKGCPRNIKWDKVYGFLDLRSSIM